MGQIPRGVHRILLSKPDQECVDVGTKSVSSLSPVSIRCVVPFKRNLKSEEEKANSSAQHPSKISATYTVLALDVFPTESHVYLRSQL